MTGRADKAIAQFLACCGASQIGFEPQASYANAAEAESAAFEFWIAYCELYYAIGRKPPPWPFGMEGPKEGTLI